TCVVKLRYVHLSDCANTILNIRLRRREGRPVMLAEKQFRRFHHAIEIQRTGLLMYITPPERRYYRSIDDSINVCLLECGITRVKVVTDGLNRQHPHIPTSVRIDRSTKFRGRDLALNLNTRNLPFGMYSCVSASGSMNVNTSSINQRQS